MKRTNLLGPWGESLAADYLRRRGYAILAANYRCRYGEIDLIAEKGGMVAFVEVKLRAGSGYGEAKEFVDRRKQQKLRSSALLWLAGRGEECPCRFDVVEIYAPEGVQTKRPRINHLENVF